VAAGGALCRDRANDGARLTRGVPLPGGGARCGGPDPIIGHHDCASEEVGDLATTSPSRPSSADVGRRDHSVVSEVRRATAPGSRLAGSARSRIGRRAGRVRKGDGSGALVHAANQVARAMARDTCARRSWGWRPRAEGHCRRRLGGRDKAAGVSPAWPERRQTPVHRRMPACLGGHGLRRRDLACAASQAVGDAHQCPWRGSGASRPPPAGALRPQDRCAPLLFHVKRLGCPHVAGDRLDLWRAGGGRCRPGTLTRDSDVCCDAKHYPRRNAQEPA
jgi:hypothetical protein